ncbi:Histidine acid phosphatase [Caulobacter sp. AP07]|uniref:histidine-type phosphatase n=1 Tax=Caulobacter sp. AP07 TaxID=1144304 RepID=UPI000272158D|nr:histidine-type phosphatase [Caulobacter sp. AP07]EJL38031.1 Histidine acid phosphatase [Caulobacter sp. AP07]
MRFVASLTSFLILALTVGLATPAGAQQAGDRLEKVVILTRHGVRAAMSSPENLETASARPWPRFSVPAGHLTPNGAALSTLFGAYYRELYTSEGLLTAGDCGAVYYWANVTQRTIATAEALSEGLSPGCASMVHTVGEGRVDPLFEPVGAGVAKPDLALARAAVKGRVGGGLAAWSASHRDAVETLDALLMQCERRPCPVNTGAGKRRVIDAVPAFDDNGGETVGIAGPEAFASGVTESLLMAWADGQDFAGLGWKGLDQDTLLRVFALHQAEFDLRLRTPYVDQVASSYLASRLLATLLGDADGAAIGEASSRIVVVVGHDGTLAMLAGLLRLDWTAPGYQPGQIAPGGALVFERWRRADGQRVIRARFTVQTLPQLRERTPLSSTTPPAVSPLFIPACSEATTAFDCPLEVFDWTVRSAVDRRFIHP